MRKALVSDSLVRTEARTVKDAMEVVNSTEVFIMDALASNDA
jgi:hypothetical protein